jgi:glycosyltransferase involved in cell wall biosynthesis
MSFKRYCFVVPRYFEGLAGGAETLLGALATKLAERGHDIELLATCAKDNRTWLNEFPPGESALHGVRLKRFLVDDRSLDRWIPIQVAIHQGKNVSYEEQLTWMQESVNSSAMYRYIAEHGESFDAIFFGPYLFGTTFWGSQIHPHKSILVPCLHDEAYAYLDLIAAMFRNVRGCLFNAEPEMHLARSLYGEIPGGVVGLGFEPPTPEYVAGLEPYFSEPFPYLLYLGRKEMGKNAQVLIDYFCQAKGLGLLPDELRLVVLGGGSFSDLHRMEALERSDIIDLPHLSERDKQRVLRHALCLAQPSLNESFSIVLMEAWMVGTPVIVHGECPVTKHHVLESGGGLYFSSMSDLAGVVRYLISEHGARGEFAERGANYIQKHYTWEAVLSRFEEVVGQITPYR